MYGENCYADACGIWTRSIPPAGSCPMHVSNGVGVRCTHRLAHSLKRYLLLDDELNIDEILPCVLFSGNSLTHDYILNYLNSFLSNLLVLAYCYHRDFVFRSQARSDQDPNS